MAAIQHNTPNILEDILYLTQPDTVTHYLWLEPEASAQCQGIGCSNRQQQTDHMHASQAVTLVAAR